MNDIDVHIAQLNSSDEADRIYAAADIGSLGDSRGIEPLLSLVKTDPSRAVKQAALHALARIPADAVIPAAVGLLSSDDTYVRNQAVELLQGRGAQALPALREALADGSKELRKRALDSLGPGKPRIASDMCALALTDPDPNVVIAAIEQIGKTRKMEFCGPIGYMLATAEHPMVISACLEALASMGRRNR